MLYTALNSEVKSPLDDMISYDIGATKVEVNNFTELKANFKTIGNTYLKLSCILVTDAFLA